MAISLESIRLELNKRTDTIMGGLKTRSGFLQNMGVFTREFLDGKSWFDYRLSATEEVDAKFGRYDFPGQSSFYGNDLTQLALVRRSVPDIGLRRGLLQGIWV